MTWLSGDKQKEHARPLGRNAAELLMQHNVGMLRKFCLEFHFKKSLISGEMRLLNSYYGTALITCAGSFKPTWATCVKYGGLQSPSLWDVCAQLHSAARR